MLVDSIRRRLKARSGCSINLFQKISWRYLETGRGQIDNSSRSNHLVGAGGGNRTLTGREPHGILRCSPQIPQLDEEVRIDGLWRKFENSAPWPNPFAMGFDAPFLPVSCQYRPAILTTDARTGTSCSLRNKRAASRSRSCPR